MIGGVIGGVIGIFRESDDARIRRLKDANEANNEGIQFFENGDFAKSLGAYEKAARLNPDNIIIRQNLAKARERVATATAEQAVAKARAETEQRNRQLAKEAAEQIHNSVEKLVLSVTVAPTGKGGLDFDPGNAPVSQRSGGLDFTADIAADGKTRTGAFGEKVSNPAPGAPLGDRPVGTNINPGDQLGSIAKNENALGSLSSEAASQKAREGFDEGVKQQGSLSDVKVETPTGTMQMPPIPPAIANDKVIKASVDRYNKWLPERDAARKEVERAQVTSDLAKDPGAKAAALTVLNAAKSKSDGLEVAVKSAVKEVSERMITLGTLPVFAAPLADSKAANPILPGGKKQ